jgi:hypothetical protein
MCTSRVFGTSARSGPHGHPHYHGSSGIAQLPGQRRRVGQHQRQTTRPERLDQPRLAPSRATAVTCGGSVISPAATLASPTSPNWTATSCAVISATSRGCAPAPRAPGDRWPSPPDPADSSHCAASCDSPPANSGYPVTSGPASMCPSCPNACLSHWKPVTGISCSRRCPTTRCPSSATAR